MAGPLAFGGAGMRKARPSPPFAGSFIEDVHSKPLLVSDRQKTRSSLYGPPFAWYRFGFT